jgi:hypothetical protein
MTRSRVILVLARCVAVLLLLQGVVGLVLPDIFAGVVSFMQRPPAIYGAVIVRIAIGCVLLAAAGASRMPMFLRIFGGLVLMGGLLTPIWGTYFAEVILGWWSSQGSGLVRVFAAGALALGFCVGYAVLPRARESRN